MEFFVARSFRLGPSARRSRRCSIRTRLVERKPVKCLRKSWASGWSDWEPAPASCSLPSKKRELWSDLIACLHDRTDSLEPIRRNEKDQLYVAPAVFYDGDLSMMTFQCLRSTFSRISLMLLHGAALIALAALTSASFAQPVQVGHHTGEELVHPQGERPSAEQPG